MNEKKRGPLPVTVRDAKTGKTKKFKTETMNKANRTARGAERREGTRTGKALNTALLGAAAIDDVLRFASGTERGEGASSYIPPAVRAGIKSAEIKKERGDKKMMGGGSLKMDKMKMAGGGMMEDMKAAGIKMADGGKMPMDAKTGKPVFAVDGKGKMGHGGMAYGKKDKMGHGGMAYGKKKMMHGGGAKAFKRKGSGEQTVARGSGAARPQIFRKNG